jgi:hypothetical protein
VGVRGVAEQLGALGAQREDLGDDRVVVVLAAVVAAADERAPHLLAQIAAVGAVRNGLDISSGC